MPKVTAPRAPVTQTVSTVETPVKTSAPVAPSASAGVDTFAAAPETPVREIPLTGPITDAKMQISGMAWAGDTLVMLPQYLNYNGSSPRLFSLQRADVIAHLDDPKPMPLTPREITVHPPNLDDHFPGFEGFEAIAFSKDRAFMLVEAEVDGQMKGYLVAGKLTTEGLTLDLTTIREMNSDSHVVNMGFEALTVVGNQVLVMPEANGALLNPRHVAHAFDFDLKPMGEVKLPTLEYRLTDSTPADADGRFWVANYNHPGDQGMDAVGPDGYASQFGVSPSYVPGKQVERLIPLRKTDEGVVPTGEAPIQMQLAEGEGRNWEALAPLPGRGFLVMTDEFPRTIFGFVPSVTD